MSYLLLDFTTILWAKFELVMQLLFGLTVTNISSPSTQSSTQILKKIYLYSSLNSDLRLGIDLKKLGDGDASLHVLSILLPFFCLNIYDRIPITRLCYLEW